MFPIIAALIVGGLALASSHEKSKAKSAGKEPLGPDGKPLPKPKTPEEIFAEGKAAGAKETDAAWKNQLARDAAVAKTARKAARNEMALSIAATRAPHLASPDDDDDPPAGKVN
jgi:hypothetical protein